MKPRKENLTEENRGRFRGFTTPDIWSQIVRYGMGQGSSFPESADMPHAPGESEFLVMMLKAYKEQEEEKRRKLGQSIDPMVAEAGGLAGGGYLK